MEGISTRLRHLLRWAPTMRRLGLLAIVTACAWQATGGTASVGADGTSPTGPPAMTVKPAAAQPYTVTQQVGGISVTTNVSPSTAEPMNTVINGSTTSPQNKTCSWSTEFGTAFGAAVGKIMLNSGYCNTNPLSALSNVLVYTAQSDGPDVAATGFHSWFQSTVYGQSDVGEVFTICLEDPIGQTKSYYCSQYTYT